MWAGTGFWRGENSGRGGRLHARWRRIIDEPLEQPPTQARVLMLAALMITKRPENRIDIKEPMLI